MTLNSLARGIATVAGVAAVAGAVTAGLTSASDAVATRSVQVQPVVFGVPMPLDPAADLPTPDQLYGVLNGLANPGVPFASKSYLVEGGIGIIEGRAADSLMRSAAAKGQLPLTFNVSGITPVGTGLLPPSPGRDEVPVAPPGPFCGAVQAVRALSVCVRAGEIVGVAGVSGNGQRELVEQAQAEGGSMIQHGTRQPAACGAVGAQLCLSIIYQVRLGLADPDQIGHALCH